MASKTVAVDSDAYTKLDTGAATAILVQNKSEQKINIIFAASTPDINSEADFVLDPQQAIQRNGQADDMYAATARRGLTYETGNKPKVTVGE